VWIQRHQPIKGGECDGDGEKQHSDRAGDAHFFCQFRGAVKILPRGIFQQQKGQNKPNTKIEK
jgi:hypothetical protein